MNRTTSPYSSFPTHKGNPPSFMKGHTWCTCKCFDCSKVIKAESKTKLRLAFYNHVCSNNYGDDELLPGVKSIKDVVADHIYQSKSPPLVNVARGAPSKAPKHEQSMESNLALKAKVQEVVAKLLAPRCKHKMCMPDNCFSWILQWKRWRKYLQLILSSDPLCQRKPLPLNQ